MIRTRVIPCLLLRNLGLVKTVRFKDPKYLGDPINIVKIFNDKEVDELVFLDITATVENKKPPFGLLEKIASECFMPLGYGGGVRSLEDMKTQLEGLNKNIRDQSRRYKRVTEFLDAATKKAEEEEEKLRKGLTYIE